MIRTKIDKDSSVESMPSIIIEYFNALSDVPNTNFIIAGYDTIGSEKQQRLYVVNVNHKKIEKINTDAQGARWDGETSTLTRLLQDVSIKADNGEYISLPFGDVLWSYFTLQDAVDFARYAVKTTIQTMRFKNVVETVGGSVDILVITPDETKWLQKENLK